MRILFIEPKGTVDAINLGFAYLCSSVINQGHTGFFIDLNRFSESDSEKIISESIETNQPEIIALSVYDVNFKRALKNCEFIKIKYPHLTIVMGGPHVKALKDKTLDSEFIDYAFHGECENAFNDFLKKWGSGEDFKNTDGLIYRNSINKVIVNPARKYDDVNSLPTPNYDYWNVKEIPGYMLLTSRGCPYQCSFCSRNLGQKWRKRNPKQCVEELIEAKRKWNIQGFRIIDASFNLMEKHVIDFCNELKKSELNLPWMASGIRVDLLTDASVKAMKDANCQALMVGIESVAPKVVELMKKSLTFDEVQRGYSYCKKYNLKMAGYMIVGLPGDTYQDAIHYGRKVVDLGIDPLSFNSAVPLHGTPLYDWVQDQNNATTHKNISWMHAYSDTEVAFETSDFTVEERLRARKELLQYMDQKRRERTPFYLRWLFQIEKKLNQNFGLKKRMIASYLINRVYPYAYSETCSYQRVPDGLREIKNQNYHKTQSSNPSNLMTNNQSVSIEELDKSFGNSVTLTE